MQKGGNKVTGVRGKAVANHLSAEDESVVRNFVSEFVGQKLIPHLEAVLKNLNEWVSECSSAFLSVYLLLYLTIHFAHK